MVGHNPNAGAADLRLEALSSCRKGYINKPPRPDQVLPPYPRKYPFTKKSHSLTHILEPKLSRSKPNRNNAIQEHRCYGLRLLRYGTLFPILSGRIILIPSRLKA